MAKPPHKAKLGRGSSIWSYTSDGEVGSPVGVVMGGVNSLTGGWPVSGHPKVFNP